MTKIKLELHTHTKYSYDTNLDFKNIIQKCKKKNIKALAVTDHNEIEGALRLSKLAPFKVIVGEEIKTRDGEIIGLFLKKYIKPGQSIEKTISEIRKQKGLVYLPHPFDKTTRKTSVNENFLQKVAKKSDFIEIYNGRTIRTRDNKSALNLNKSIEKIGLVGSDAHTIYEFGRNYIEIDNFKDQKDFKLKVKTAKLHVSKVMYFVFLVTKIVRFWKKNFFRLPKIVQETNLKCDLCDSKKYVVIYKRKGKESKKYLISDNSYGVHPQIVKCFDCGLIYCYPRINKETLVKKYKNFVDVVYEKERVARIENQSQILYNLQKFLPKKGKILDIGAATGAFLQVAKKKGWNVSGIEPSLWATRYAKKYYNLIIKNGTLHQDSFKQKNFDAISLIDVIEHVDSPRKLLESSKLFLKKNGVVVLVTPNYSSWISKILGERWWHVRPDHIYYFDIDSLTMLVESLNFKILKIKYPGWNFSYDYWITRFKKKLPIVYLALKHLKSYKFLNAFTSRNYNINFHDSIEMYLKLNE